MKSFKGLEVNFKVGGITYHATLDEDTVIDQMDLDTEFADQARRFAWWAMVCELAKDRMFTQKAELEQLYARLDHKVRGQAVIAKAKLTEKMVENSVITDPVYVQGQKDYLGSRKDHAMLARGVEALAQRKEMLISLGANARASLVMDPSMKKEGSKARAGHVIRTQQHQGGQQPPPKQPVRQPVKKRQPMRAAT